MGSLAESSKPRPLHVPRAASASAPLGQAGRAIHRILVCIDRSAFSDPCMRHAITLAKSLGGALTLVHVMQPAYERSGLPATDVLDWEAARQEALAYLETLQRAAAKELQQHVDTRLEQGHPAERITAVARELDADLTILGSQGEHGAARWNLGSTVQQVLAIARGSVLIVRKSPLHADAALTRILIPLDGSRRAESVLPTAVRLAKSHGAELLLAFVVREPVPTAILRSGGDFEVAQALATRLERTGAGYLEGLTAQMKREGVSARGRVIRSADERQSLLELSEAERSDLIVVSAHGSTCNPSLTCGSITAHLLTHALVPLMVLQDLREPEPCGETQDWRAPALRASFPEGI